MKVGKEQLPVITTSAEADDQRECADVNRKERGGIDDGGGATADTATAPTADGAPRSQNQNGNASIASAADFPNFGSALQFKDDEPAMSRALGVANRPIYPNIPYSPYSSPRAVRRKSPLKESRRVSIDKCGSYQQLNQYKLIDSIGQVRVIGCSAS